MEKTTEFFVLSNIDGLMFSPAEQCALITCWVGWDFLASGVVMQVARGKVSF